MTTPRIAAVCWILVGVLLAVPAAVFATGAPFDAWWTNLFAYLLAAAGAALLLSQAPRWTRIALGIFAAGWAVAAAALIAWVFEVQLVAAVLVAVGGLGLAIAVLATRPFTRFGRAAIAAAGMLSVAYWVVNLTTIPVSVGLIVVILTGVAFFAAGLALLRTRRAQR